jgi:DNA-3-methyladenine glycosylase
MESPISNSIPLSFFEDDTVTVARNLIGKELIYRDCSGIIVETEAYKDDAASHYVTRPKLGKMLSDTFGCVYIYLIYGMYYCLNFTTEKHGIGAVLVRGVEPRSGRDLMERRRPASKRRELTNGPAKLFLAFGLHPKHHGEKIGQNIHVVRGKEFEDDEIGTSPRIGVSKAMELPWRFFLKENEYVSPYAKRPR